MTSDLESQIAQWRRYVNGHPAIAPADIEEMEGHLRDQVADLVSTGLSEDEAFLVAVKRMGNLDDISHEFAREHSERLWKQLVLTSTDGRSPGVGSHLPVAIGFAIAAAVTVRLSMTFVDASIVGPNISLIVLPFITAYLGWTRQLRGRAVVAAVATYAVAALAMNAYPWDMHDGDSRTQVLAFTHLPIVLWLVVGLAYVGGQWHSHAKRMDFIRFTGEWVVYMALLALGGGVMTGLTVASFSALGVGHEDVIASWIIPMGAAGATVVAAWLVDAKQAVVENIAPVLTKVFTPLALVMLIALLSAVAARRSFADLDRELLTLVDLILALVLGLVLYAISARDPLAQPSLFDRLQFVLLAVALATDAVLLVAMLARIVDAGFTANKVAALGMNLVLLVNLAWSTRLLARFNRGAAPFTALERWQTAYLPVYGLWAAFVVVALPPIFRFA